MFHGAFNYCLLCHCRHLSLQIDGIITTQAEIHSAVCPPLPPSLHNSLSPRFSAASRAACPGNAFAPSPRSTGGLSWGQHCQGRGLCWTPPVLEQFLLSPRCGASAGGLGSSVLAAWAGGWGMQGDLRPLCAPCSALGVQGTNLPQPTALYCWAGDAGGLQAPCTTHPCRRPALHPPACQHITPKQAPSPCSHSHGCVPQPSLPCKPPARESLRVWESPKPSVGSMGAQE